MKSRYHPQLGEMIQAAFDNDLFSELHTTLGKARCIAGELRTIVDGYNSTLKKECALRRQLNKSAPDDFRLAKAIGDFDQLSKNFGGVESGYADLERDSAEIAQFAKGVKAMFTNSYSDPSFRAVEKWEDASR